MSENDTKPTMGKTPQGQIAPETPTHVRPSVTGTWGSMRTYLGDPLARYGSLSQGDKISMSVKLQMIGDPVIAFTLAYISSKLVKAEYIIECADKDIQAFFAAMYGAFHREFMLQSSMAVALGCCGLIKRYAFQAPKPLAVGDPVPWSGQTVPYICTGLDQVNPVGAVPTFSKAGKFTGFSYAEGDVDRLYALWITIGRHVAFGKYSGWGRLNNAYKSWWLGEFDFDQLAVHMQKFVDRAVLIDFPPGKTQDGEEMSDKAIAMGDDIRAGATAAIPSTVYDVYEGDTGMEKLTAIRKWAVRLLESAENIQAFISLADHIDSRKAMAMLLPFQTYQQVKQSSLGGPTTADVLGKLATDLLIGDAHQIDFHVNDYLFDYLVNVNFGPNAPRVYKRTTGLNEYDRGELFDLLKALVAKKDADAGDRVDIDELAHRLDVPLVAQELVPMTEGEGGAGLGLAAAEYDPAKNPPMAVLERIVSEEIVDDDDKAAVFTEEDIERVRGLMEQYPELAELDTLEVNARAEETE